LPTLFTIVAAGALLSAIITAIVLAANWVYAVTGNQNKSSIVIND
jgi:hypothetical protein